GTAPQSDPRTNTAPPPPPAQTPEADEDTQDSRDSNRRSTVDPAPSTHPTQQNRPSARPHSVTAVQAAVHRAAHSPHAWHNPSPESDINPVQHTSGRVPVESSNQLGGQPFKRVPQCTAHVAQHPSRVIATFAAQRHWFVPILHPHSECDTSTSLDRALQHHQE